MEEPLSAGLITIFLLSASVLSARCSERVMFCLRGRAGICSCNLLSFAIIIRSSCADAGGFQEDGSLNFRCLNGREDGSEGMMLGLAVEGIRGWEAEALGGQVLGGSGVGGRWNRVRLNWR